MRPLGTRPLGGVPALAVAVAVVFVAVAASAEAVVAVRGVRVAGAAAFERAGRAAGDFAGVARLLFVLITPNVSGGGLRREGPGDLRREPAIEGPAEIASVPIVEVVASM